MNDRKDVYKIITPARTDFSDPSVREDWWGFLELDRLVRGAGLSPKYLPQNRTFVHVFKDYIPTLRVITIGAGMEGTISMKEYTYPEVVARLLIRNTERKNED